VVDGDLLASSKYESTYPSVKAGDEGVMESGVMLMMFLSMGPRGL
jgi:hypothetical protein